MKLTKRICDFGIELTPMSADFLRIDFHVKGETIPVFASAAMGGQFFDFVHMLYGLYDEWFKEHMGKNQYVLKDGIFDAEHYISRDARIMWDEEGSIVDIFLSRKPSESFPYPCKPGEPDPFTVSIKRSGDKAFIFDVDGKDLAYAVAKACTDVLKKYGFQGYSYETSYCNNVRDHFMIEELLFIKAYALDAFNVRETREVDRRNFKSGRYFSIKGSSFEKEIELLLFDM